MKKILLIILKIIIKIIVNVALAVFLLASLFFSSEGPKYNLILFPLILGIIIAYNTSTTKKAKPIALAILVGCSLLYLAVPKKHKACGATSDGLACTTQYCIGLPITAFIEPICLGRSFGATHSIN